LVGAHHPLNFSWILAARQSDLDLGAAPPPLDGDKGLAVSVFDRSWSPKDGSAATVTRG
jgi:hypothetical protein